VERSSHREPIELQRGRSVKNEQQTCLKMSHKTAGDSGECMTYSGRLFQSDTQYDVNRAYVPGVTLTRKYISHIPERREKNGRAHTATCGSARKCVVSCRAKWNLAVNRLGKLVPICRDWPSRPQFEFNASCVRVCAMYCFDASLHQPANCR